VPDDGSKEPKHVAYYVVYVILIPLLCRRKVHFFTINRLKQYMFRTILFIFSVQVSQVV